MITFEMQPNLAHKSQDFKDLQGWGLSLTEGGTARSENASVNQCGSTTRIAAYDGGVSERTLRNYLGRDLPSLDFVDRLPCGGIATCSQSMRAWNAFRKVNDGRKKEGTWRTNFVRDMHVTEVSGGSVVGIGNNNEKE